MTTSSPGCRLAGVCGTLVWRVSGGVPLGWRCPGGRPGRVGLTLAPGGAAADCGFAGAIATGWFEGAVPGGGASGSDSTGPGKALPCCRPGGGRVGAGGSTRPCGGNSGTSSSSSGTCGWLLPRGIPPGGRGGGSEKIVPICACAGETNVTTVAAKNTARLVVTRFRDILRGFNSESGFQTLYGRLTPPPAVHPVNTQNTAEKGQLRTNGRTVASKIFVEPGVQFTPHCGTGAIGFDSKPDLTPRQGMINQDQRKSAFSRPEPTNELQIIVSFSPQLIRNLSKLYPQAKMSDYEVTTMT